MERRFLPVLFLLLTVTASTVLATGNGDLQYLRAGEENSGLRPEPECRIPPYSDPERIIRESEAIDKKELLLEGRCYVACVSYIDRTNPPSSPSDKPKIQKMYDISVYWPTVRAKNCKFERMIHECVRGCTLPPPHSDDDCPRACLNDCYSECGGTDQCENPDQHERWVPPSCQIGCASNINKKTNLCRVGCNEATALRLNGTYVDEHFSEVGPFPKDPIGPSSLTQSRNTERSGQFSIDFSNAAPQPQECDQRVNASPVAFLFRFEETMSHNVSYIWMPNPLKQQMLDLADYACQELSVSFAVTNKAGLSNFSTPQIITVDGVPSNPVDVRSYGDVVVWNEPLSPNSQVTEYEIQFLVPDTQLRINRLRNSQGTFYAVQDEDKLGGIENTYFRVRARTLAGAGQWSTEIPLRSSMDVTPTPPTTCPTCSCPTCTCPVCPTTAPPCTCGTESPTFPPLLQGVHFVLRGRPLANNSVIALADIGELDGALLCRTNLISCCGTVPNRFGQFYYPSGEAVPINSQQQGFYRNRGDQEIRLHRRSGVDYPTGKFRCEIPDSNMIVRNLFIELI